MAAMKLESNTTLENHPQQNYNNNKKNPDLEAFASPRRTQEYVFQREEPLGSGGAKSFRIS